MRIPRTNFPPATFSDEESDFRSDDFGAQLYDDAGEPIRVERRTVESPPAENWESHFFLAPNVRFTRTPEREIHGRLIEPMAEEFAVPAAAIAEVKPVAESRPQLLAQTASPVHQLSQTLHAHPWLKPRIPAEAAPPASLPETAMVLQGRMDAVAPTVPVSMPRATIATPRTIPAAAPTVAPITAASVAAAQSTGTLSSPAASPLAQLSDFAFWDAMAFDVADMPAPTAVIAMPTVEVWPDSIAAKFRIIECRVPQLLRWPEPAPVAHEMPAAPLVVAPAPMPLIAPTPIMPAAVAPVAFAAPIATPVPVPAPVAVPAPASVAEAPVVAAAAVPDNLFTAPAVVPTAMPLHQAIVEPARRSETSGVAISKPFQINQGANLRVSHGEYEFPPRALLQNPPETVGFVMSQEQLERNAGFLESVLEDFGVRGEIIHVRPGPVVTLYEFEPAPGVKSSRVIGLADDIARSMSALSARVAVVPGRNVIGIELPNATRETVYFGEMIDSPDFSRNSFKLPICLGKTIGGEPVIAELAKMPHLLVAGTTGSGKSVAINTMILSLLYRLTPEECRLIMVDPKMLELSVYDGIPHLLTPVVTDPKKAVLALKWAVREMEDRYRKMSKLGVRNIDGYNARAALAREKGETINMIVQTGFEKGTGQAINESLEMDLSPMPYIVVIVDEMADLMMVAGKEIEGAIQRLAQMARAAGIHLIMATQRPSVDVITGTIKANFPTRISFQVTSKIDSRTILGEQGAEQLLGQGDMLHMAGGGRISRVHGPFVSDDEVEKVVAHLKTQGRPEYLDTVTTDEDGEEEEAEDSAVFDKSAMGGEDGNDLYDNAVKVVLRDKKCSTSYIQRRLGIGYNRAASLVERMEKEGLVGSPNHVGKRVILNGSRDALPTDDNTDID